MRDGVFRHFPKRKPAIRQKRNEPAPLIDAKADHEWLRANPDELAFVHEIPLDVGGAQWPVVVIACRVHDRCSPDGWRPAWLEISHDPFDDTGGPSFASPEWARVKGTLCARAKFILAVIDNAARTRPDAMLVRDLLVVLRSAELGHAAEAFRFIEND